MRNGFPSKLPSKRFVAQRRGEEDPGAKTRHTKTSKVHYPMLVARTQVLTVSQGATHQLAGCQSNVARLQIIWPLPRIHRHRLRCCVSVAVRTNHRSRSWPSRRTGTTLYSAAICRGLCMYDACSLLVRSLPVAWPRCRWCIGSQHSVFYYFG